MTFYHINRLELNFTLTVLFFINKYFLLECKTANAHVNNIINFGPGDNIPGWTVNCPDREGDKDYNGCKWNCYLSANPIGEISTVLHGRGRAMLDYGQCGRVDCGLMFVWVIVGKPAPT